MYYRLLHSGVHLEQLVHSPEPGIHSERPGASKLDKGANYFSQFETIDLMIELLLSSPNSTVVSTVSTFEHKRPVY